MGIKKGKSIFRFEQEAGIDSPLGNWRKNHQKEKDNYPIEKNKQKKCYIEFKPDNKDHIYDGTYGFDKYSKRKFGKFCTSDLNKLKNEYQPITVNGEEYLPPWISIRKGQTIILEISKLIIKETFEKYEKIVFDEKEGKDDFSIEPINTDGTKVPLRDAKKLKITCKENNKNRNTIQIKVLADGDNAGALNFFYPRPKTINLKWYFVKLTDKDPNDREELNNKLQIDKLERVLRRALRPTLIDVNIINNAAEIIEVSLEYMKYLRGRGTFGSIIFRNNTINYIVREKFLLLRNIVEKIHDKNILNCMCINRHVLREDSTTIDNPEILDFIAGLSETGTGLAYLILDDRDQIKVKNIAHEVLHSLGLEHTFLKKEQEEPKINQKHTFKLKKTENYMDYMQTDCQYTWKWQWEILHEYQHVK